MQWRLLSNVENQRTYAVVFDEGDEVLQGLHAVAVDERLSAASFTAVGGFERVVLGYFEMSRRDYKRIPLNEQVEVLTLAGDRRLGEAIDAQPALPVWPGAYLARVWRGRELAWEGRVAVASDKTARIDLASP